MWSPTVTKKRRKRHTDEFKAEVLRAIETRGQRTIGEVAASLGVSESLIQLQRVGTFRKLSVLGLLSSPEEGRRSAPNRSSQVRGLLR